MRFFILTLTLVSFLSFSLAKPKLTQKEMATLADMLKSVNGNRQNVNNRASAIKTPWNSILNGLLRSQDFASIAAQIPCDIVDTLENSAEEAEQFVQEIQAGQVPTIIQDLPSEIVDAFGSMVNVALALPQAIWDTAEDIVDGFEGVFDSIADGSIVSELPQEIADAWETVTAGFVDAWDAVTADIACFFGDCAEPTAGGCAAGVPASAFPSATPVVYYNTTSAAYSYDWALSSAVAAASSAAYIQATASASSLHPVSIGTSLVPVATSVVVVSPSASSQPVADAAAHAVQDQAMGLVIGVMVVIGGLLVWV